MNAKRLYFVLIGFLILLIIGGGSAFVFADSFLSKQANKVSDLKVQQAVLEAQESSFIKARNDLKKYESLKASIDRVLPEDKDQARAVRELFTIAEETGMKISQITFPTSDLGRQTKTPAATSTPGTASPAPSSSPTTTPSITQAKPVDGISGVLGITAAVEVGPMNEDEPITYGDFLEFMNKLEQNRRTMQVSQVTLNPVEQQQGGEFDFSFSVTIFVKP